MHKSKYSDISRIRKRSVDIGTRCNEPTIKFKVSKTTRITVRALYSLENVNENM